MLSCRLLCAGLYNTVLLLLCRVVPNRREQPEAYRLYLELLGRYAVAPVYPERMEKKDM